MLDFFGEIGGFPWVYRGWIYVFSEAYRINRKQDWSRLGKMYKVFDISMSLIMICLEISLIVLIVIWAL